MNQDAIFESWAPAESLWSPWVKPVLFAALHEPPPVRELPVVAPLTGVPPPGGTVLVLDLPDASGVLAGLALAQSGYRPVPLYNAVPGPLFDEESDPASLHVAVDVRTILYALHHGGAALTAEELAPDAPPAFLLDARRRGGVTPSSPGSFDNRSVSFTTDFPSANFLQAHGFNRVLLIQLNAAQPQPDLAHTLLNWQQGGLVIELLRTEKDYAPKPCVIERPSRFRLVWHRALEMLGFRRHELGGFGGLLPDPSAG